MATDNSPPRTRLILLIALATVVILTGLKFIFDSYFTDMMEGEAMAKIAKPEELHKLREDERKRLEESPIPISQAMHELATKGRLGSDVITPKASDDEGPLVGWSKAPKTLDPVPAPPGTDPSATTDGGPNAVVTDGGSPASSAAPSGPDASSSAAVTIDGGVRTAVPPSSLPHTGTFPKLTTTPNANVSGGDGGH